ncbi:ubiquinol-cytochrome C chaperone family protein [Parasphingorhabdus sp. DH2-15]|uniref:ubiquinol-cytochrome C chaperone family protein n=1 Tax=Parasphingorhabdus sp. DH2-15 TaxID=3444112 RepID=UPI003F683B79
MRSIFTPLSRLFRKDDRRDAVMPLYNAIVAEARNPYWYEAGGLKDTINGRFNMLITLIVLVLLKLESIDGQDEASVAITELFVDDMDEQMRQQGIGDVVVGKRIGKMVSALGGRLTVFRKTFLLSGDDRNTAMDALLKRNLYEDEDVSQEALRSTRNALIARYEGLQAHSTDRIFAGDLWSSL